MSAFRSFFFLLAIFAAQSIATAGEPVEVVGVRFQTLRPSNGTSRNWYEADIALMVHPPADARGQMVSRVKVSLWLEFELHATARRAREQEYYRADAECVALEAGRANVRFYLPPELVKRDELHAEPKRWGVELTVGDRRVAPSSAAFGRELRSADAWAEFQERAVTLATANEGLLQPQYLTPFAGEYARLTPTFVRRERH